MSWAAASGQFRGAFMDWREARADRVIEASPSLEPLPPANTGVDNRVVVNSPADFANWAALFTAHPPVAGFEYQFKEGDYRSWGGCSITNAQGGGAAGNRCRMRYVGDNQELHPAIRKATSDEAVFDRFLFNGSTVQHWLLHGLTQRAPTVGDTDIISGADDIVLDYFLLEDVDRSYGVRVRSGTANWIQRGVIRSSVNYGTGAGDVGINVVAQDGSVTGTRILDMEVYDWGDSFQASPNAADEMVATDGLIEGCDFYLTSARQTGGGTTANAENAIDFKIGSDAVPWIVRRNRMWGFRKGAEATGELVVVHVVARNLVFEDNVFDDAPSGIVVTRWNPAPAPLGQDTPRNIVVRGNWFQNLRPYAAADGAGAAWRTVNNERFERNVIAKSDALEYIHNAIIDAGGPSYAANLRVGGVLRQHTGTSMSVYGDRGNRVTREPTTYCTYQRKRWTGIETVDGPLPRRW